MYLPIHWIDKWTLKHRIIFPASFPKLWMLLRGEAVGHRMKPFCHQVFITLFFPPKMLILPPFVRLTATWAPSFSWKVTSLKKAFLTAGKMEIPMLNASCHPILLSTYHTFNYLTIYLRTSKDETALSCPVLKASPLHILLFQMVTLGLCTRPPRPCSRSLFSWSKLALIWASLLI